MNRKQKEIIKEITSMVLDYNCDTFHCWLDFSGHVECISLRYQTPNQLSSTYIEISRAPSPQHIIDLRAAKAEHDKLYAPENIETTKEAARLAKIAELQKQIEALS